MAKIVETKNPMPQQDPKERAKNFNEVPLGYSPETAIAEATRCLQCKKPTCVDGCPVNIDIPAFIAKIKEGDFLGASLKLKEKNTLPAVCGRVCPQEEQCEKLCVLAKKFQPVGIGHLERFAADYEAGSGKTVLPDIPKPNGKSVAIVGAGPAGLTVAGDLIKLGYKVTIYESLHKSGGVLVYGIPEFRLPKAIVQREVDYLQKLGVEVRTNIIIGYTYTIDDLFKMGYHSVFLGIGAGLPIFLGIPGENLNGVYSANEYLTRSNLMKAYLFPEYDTPVKKGKRVAVVGGGNVAMDSARTALRLGSEKVYLVYRRSKKEMPARIEEVHHAEEEGIDFRLLTNPTRIIGNEKGFVNAIECQEMELGEPDASGRRRPVPKKGSEFVLDVDIVIMAIGTAASKILTSTSPDMKLNDKGYIIADETTGRTSKEGVYAGGDIVTGSATVILAAGAGRKSATAMHEYLK